MDKPKMTKKEAETERIMKAMNEAKTGKQSEPEKHKTEAPKTISQDKGTPPSRVGKKPVIAYIDPAGMRELKMYGVETGRSQQDMLLEAINDFLIKYHKKGLA